MDLCFLKLHRQRYHDRLAFQAALQASGQRNARFCGLPWPLVDLHLDPITQLFTAKFASVGGKARVGSPRTTLRCMDSCSPGKSTPTRCAGTATVAPERLDAELRPASRAARALRSLSRVHVDPVSSHGQVLRLLVMFTRVWRDLVTSV